MADRILVVDDDLDSLKLIGLLLQRQGYQVVAAPGGSEGLAMAKSETPDLILLDVMMPNMDGYEVCRRLRSDPKLAHIPVIMFTAKTRVDDKVAGLEAGADDYLTKPTHPAELASRIKALLARSATVRSVVMEHPQGKVVAIMGVKGGTGTTTLAINLGVVLTQLDRSLILADLHAGMSTIGLQLGYHQEDGLSRLLELSLLELTQDQVEGELTDHPSGMRLLLSTYNPAEGIASYSVRHVEQILAMLPRIADLSLLDLGSGIGPVSLQALKQADQIIFCLPPQPAAITMAGTLFEQLTQSGIHPDRVGAVIANTSALIPTVSTTQVQEQLQLSVLASIESAPEVAVSSVEQEQPMTLLQPQSVIADQFRELAQGILARLEYKE